MNIGPIRTNLKRFFKQLRYLFEAIFVVLGMLVFRMIGLKNSSSIGSSLARKIGRLISVDDLAKRNIKKSFYDLSNQEIDKILDGMWDNLGRVVGEFVHISRLKGSELTKYINIEKQSLENIEYIKNHYQGGIIFSGHLANWEIGPKIFLEHGINVKTVYRPLNNKIVDYLTASTRGVELIAKSAKGNKKIISEIKNGNYVIILADQRISDGIMVPFFGRNAMTTASIAKMALRYKIPLIPARSIRIGKNFKFLVDVEKPLEFEETDNINKDNVLRLTTKINQKLEDWIKEYPSQWFWVHDRWKS